MLLGLTSTVPATAHAQVTFDKQSLKIDGRRVVLLSGEVHYSRMPDPREWPIVLRRVRAAGFNAISTYIPWGYHEPTQSGPGRWTGRYDLERFLKDARDAGLYVVARHGPYVQGEMDAGGYPPWALALPALFRTDDPAWTALWKRWDADVLPRVARWQLHGPNQGTVIGVQIENEYPGDGDGPTAYMKALYADARANGITVPILHNDQQLLGQLAAPGRFGDVVDLFGFDNYPYGFSCCKSWGTSTFGQVDGFESMYRRKGATRSPLYMPEVQGGMAPIAGDDNADPEDRYRTLHDYATVQNLSLIGQGVTMINQYMLFGGTTWGYTPFPNLGSSYDYAAPIREWTGLGDRYEEQRRLNLMLSVKPESLANTGNDATAATADDPDALYAVRRSGTDGAIHIVLRNADAGAARQPRLTIGGDTTPPVPLPGHGARYLIANANLAGWKVAWSTAEILLARGNLLVVAGDRGKPYAIRTQYGTTTFTPGNAQLLHPHKGRAILVVDRAAAGRVWTRGGETLVGPSLVLGKTVYVDRRTSIVRVRRGRLRRTRVGGPSRPTLPALTTWRTKDDVPEVRPAYDDSTWRSADAQSTPTQVQPLTRPVLFADTYAQPTGYVWYRGRYDGTAQNLCIEGRHRYGVWLNGRYLTTVTSDADVPGPMGLGGLGAFPPVPQATTVALPQDAQSAQGPNVLAVLTDDWGHTMDAEAFAQAKQPRGLLSASLDRGAGTVCGIVIGSEVVAFGNKVGTLPQVPGVDGGIAWKLRGGRPEDYPNASGLTGERDGYYRPSYDDSAWGIGDQQGLLPGLVRWYRTTFRLKLSKRLDAPLGLEIPQAAQPGELFVNGVHVARPGRDRNTRFVIMPGLLRTDGRPNTVAYVRWNITGATLSGLPHPNLVAYDTQRRIALR